MDREALGKVAYDGFWAARGVSSETAGAQWPVLSPEYWSYWAGAADAVAAAILAGLTAEGRLVDAGYLRLLQNLARHTDRVDQYEARHPYASPSKAAAYGHALESRADALAALRAHPTWQAAGQRQEGSSDAE